MSAQPSGRTRRTSTSNPSASSSSKDHGLPLIDGQTEPSHATGSSLSQKNDLAFGKNTGAALAQDELPQRRHRQKSSGGFLLQTLPTDIINSSSITPAEPKTSDKVRGKRKVGDGELLLPKRASARQGHRQQLSLGSSPLAAEISNAPSVEQSKDTAPEEPVLASSHGRQSARSNISSNETSPASVPPTDVTPQSARQSAIGLDMDPAQIVNLALNLSESRRRNFSGGSLLATRDSIGAKRIVSPGLPLLGSPNNTIGGSLKQYLNQQRQISTNVSPRSGRPLSSKGVSPHLSQDSQNKKRRTSALPDFRAGITEDSVFDASDATLARAEKARVAIELSYEHRRLLQWLPKLPTPSQRRPSISKGGNRSRTDSAERLGRAYNPLQYIRNRKVRLREDKPLDSEAQGWTEVEKVRDWVDTVIDQREEGISRVDKRFPLPPFDRLEPNVKIYDNALSPGVPPSQTRKMSRPLTIWEFSPEDLLADAYWLDQDDNEMRIEDSHGKKLFIANRLTHEDHPRTSKESARSSVRRSESIFRLGKSPEKAQGSYESLRSDSRERGRRRLETYEPRSPTSDDNGSQNRKSRWPKRFVRSRSPSSSGESNRNKRSGHIRGLGHTGSRDDYDNAALEKHMMDILAKEAEDSDGAIQNINAQAAREAESNRTKINDASTREEQIPQFSRRRPNAPQRLRTDMPTVKQHQESARASLDEQRFQHYRMSSDDFDLTAPNSPTASNFVPSIAINLSPSESPAMSATSHKKPLPAKLSSFRRSRSANARKLAASDDDFALESGTSTDVSRQNTNESQLVTMLRKERSAGPTNGLLSPIRSEYLGKGSRAPGDNSIRSLKGTNPSDSRFRGLLKGGRIAELVGSEVSKVGDMLWRKDNVNNISQINSPSGSTYASEESDVDDGDVSGLDNSPEDNLSRTVSRTDGQRVSPQQTPQGANPRYYMDNLPSFRSTSNRDKLRQANMSLPDHDHISRQQMALRERGRPSRFERLAPPKIDMKGISPSPSRTSSCDNAETRSGRRSSSSRSNRHVRSADRRLNAMLDIPGKAGTGKVAPTGLAALPSRQPESRGLPTLEDKRQWGISSRSVSAAHGAITKRDVARVRALLLSSGVKANEIVRRAEEIPEQSASCLRNLQQLFPDGVPALPRSQAYIVAGRTLVNKLETTTQHLREAAEQFSQKDVEGLHGQLKAIDDHVNDRLTPLVRATADDADNFSTELTTTHTLAVKQLNDSVDLILRRRRRRMRWLRRGGWALLEWTLLTIMWVVWLLVVIIRLVRGTIRGFVSGIRWLFWL